MNVGIALETDAAFEPLSVVVTDAAVKIKEYFATRDYGQDLSNIFIGVILTGPGSERLHPVRRPSYKKLLRFNNRIIKRQMEMKNVFQYDVKPDYEIFSRLNVGEARRVFLELLLDSTIVIEKHKARFPDFDLERFKEDLRSCLK
jgi:hypothetical protein